MGNPEEATANADTHGSKGSNPAELFYTGEGTQESSLQEAIQPPTITVQHVGPKKSLWEAYLLLFPIPFGFLGAPHYYLGRPGVGAVYTLTFGLLGVGWLVDLFRMPMLVRESNRRLDNPKEPQRKLLTDAYVMWLPLGLLGFHHYYLRRWPWAIAYTLTLGLFGVGWIIDGFRMFHLVKQANLQAEAEAQDPQNYDRKKKRVGEAYAFGLTPLGLLGFHHYYLGNYGFGVLYTLTFGHLGIGWISDWFRMPWLVKRANKKISEGFEGEKYLDQAYVMAFPLGFLGLHHFYLNRPGWGCFYLFTFGGLGIGWIIDLFRMPCLVKQVNDPTLRGHVVVNIQQNIDPNSGTIITGVHHQSVPPAVARPMYTAVDPLATLAPPAYDSINSNHGRDDPPPPMTPASKGMDNPAYDNANQGKVPPGPEKGMMV